MNDESIFDRARGITDSGERDKFLAQVCGENVALRQEVESLLAAHFAADNPLDLGPATGEYTPQPSVESGATADTNAAVGTIIGPYKLLQKLGEGGMGDVWVAEQEQPVKRRVALKLIKAGMDSKQVIARFEAERQALAMMDHTNIARVLDAGTTPNGRPYFAMELVKGVPITKYCDELHLSLRERMELFVPICQAIQHAHQKGIIHRDIKPSNVLVAVQDGKPVPKVIDFGVAKAIQQRLTDQSMYTEIGAVIGTLEYMSPEQAELSALDIDTRADVYALGVLLYELLTGSTPIDRKRLKQAAFVEALRMIKEEEPSKPSTRLTESKESIASLAAMRRTEPAKLTKALRGELDWIVMKCLEKDRTRRYETANGLARDIQRHLSDEAVEACPPSSGYRLRKFVWRNKAAITTATFMLLLLVGGIAATSWQAHRAELARQVAVANEKRASDERDRADQEMQTVQAVLDFVENKVFAAARPEAQDGGLGYDVKLADALKAALPFVATSFTERPLIEARLRITLGTSFWYLGKPGIAEGQYRRAFELFSTKHGPDHPDTLRSTMGLANCYSDIGQHSRALALREETLKFQKAKLGSDHPNTLRSMHNVANSYEALGRHPEAMALREETLKLSKGILGTDHSDTLTNMCNLALSYSYAGREKEAVVLLKDTLTLQKTKLGLGHPYTLNTMNILGECYARLGQRAEALKLREETLALQKARLGPDHVNTLGSMVNLARSYAALGRNSEAIKLLEEALPLMNAKFRDHENTFTCMSTLAAEYTKLGRHKEALKLHEEELARRKVILGPDHRDTLLTMNDLAICYTALGRHAEALALHEETLKLQRIKLGSDHPDTLGSAVNLASSFKTLGRLADATKLYEETLAIMKVKIPDHQFTMNCKLGLAHTYAALERYPEVLKLLEERQSVLKAKLGADHPDTAESIYSIACTHALMIAKAADRTKQADLAMDWLQQAVAAGYKDVAHMKKDTDLDPLRDREDFKKLIAELEAKAEKKN